jgi:transglutaminase-like putative cysteine protease
MKELYVHEPDGKNIRLEVERFIEEDSEWVAPLADALLKTSPDRSPRGLATHALHFVQSIPNSTNFSTGTSYLTPLGVLFENKGDCDSKSSLLASILSNLGIKWTLLDTPKHMVIGIAVPRQSNDAYYSGDLDYIVGETTIKNFPLGRWAPNQTDQRIKTIGPAKPKPPKLID